MTKPYYEHGGIKIFNGDCRDMSVLPSESVNCCVTSPPYWGLRDYKTEPQIWGGDPDCQHEWNEMPMTLTHDNRNFQKGTQEDCLNNPTGNTHIMSKTELKMGFCRKCGAWRGELGLEPTPEEYVEHLATVFREVRRVLRKDGVVFLNLGDSYYGSGKGLYGDGLSHGTEGVKQRTNAGSVGVPRVTSCDTSDKEPEGCLNRDCFCESLCGECRVAYQIGKSHNGNLHDPKQFVSPSLPNREHKESVNAHSPTSDSLSRANHSVNANLGSVHFQDHANEQPPAFQASMLDEFSRQPQEDSRQSDSPSVCPLCGRSFFRSSQEFADRLPLDSLMQSERTQDNELHGVQQERHNQYKDKACEYCIGNGSCPHYTTEYHLKPKDLVGIPWRVAFALQADGWWLRQDIIWSKVNPMPESVTDRCTKAHEYIFLLSKSARYFYDADAIKEPQADASFERAKYGWNGRTDDGSNGARSGSTFKRMAESGEPIGTILEDGMRNKRSVWTVPTHGFKEAHFATFPPKLIEPMILAGCPEGGTVLDPFLGSGTTGLVAQRLGRRAIGFELSLEYCEMAAKRNQQVGLMAQEVMK